MVEYMDKRCEKCGTGSPDAKYDKRRDVLKVTCRRCGYVWYADTLESEPLASRPTKAQFNGFAKAWMEGL